MPTKKKLKLWNALFFNTCKEKCLENFGHLGLFHHLSKNKDWKIRLLIALVVSAAKDRDLIFLKQADLLCKFLKVDYHLLMAGIKVVWDEEDKG